MKYVKTNKATSWGEKKNDFIEKLLFFLPRANPNYRFESLRFWLIEFDEEGLPCREIGLDENNVPIFLGPNERDYGFWLDTNMTIDDFKNAEAISQEYFLEKWDAINKL